MVARGYHGEKPWMRKLEEKGWFARRLRPGKTKYLDKAGDIMAVRPIGDGFEARLDEVKRTIKKVFYFNKKREIEQWRELFQLKKFFPKLSMYFVVMFSHGKGERPLFVEKKVETSEPPDKIERPT